MNGNCIMATAVATLLCATMVVSISLDVNTDINDGDMFAFERREKRKGNMRIFKGQGSKPLTEKYTHSYLFGYQEEESPTFESGEGSVNCYDEDGNEIGFFCLMKANRKVEGGDTLKANYNADLCNSEKADRDTVHCHGSPQNELYRHVIVDHMNRGYNGALSCQCGWPPVGYVSDCDVTSNDDSDRYDNGNDGVCSIEDAAERIPSQSWGSRKWGNNYICDEVGSTDCDDFRKFQDFVEELGLGDGTGSKRRRDADADGCQTEVIHTNTENGHCVTKTKYCNGITTTMTVLHPCEN